jgi:protein-arginine kinase
MALKDIIGRTYSAWMSTNAPHTDVALSSRIRLARNLGDIPFPWYASSPDLAKVAGEVEKAVREVQGLGGLEIARLWIMIMPSAASLSICFRYFSMKSDKLLKIIPSNSLTNFDLSRLL